jgi:glutaredoxin domain-containing cysteine-rich protein 1
MAGLVDPSTPAKPCKLDGGRDHQRRRRIPLRAIDGNSSAVVLYTTSLRGVRATFEACNAVRAALQAHGVAFRERDVSMDRGFRDELRSKLGLLGGARAPAASMLPRLFVRGRHVGGAEDVLRLDEEGLLAPLLEGLPRARGGGGAYCCDGCGGMRFLPCFDCSGSRKLAVTLPVVATSAAATASCRRRKKAGTVVVVRCGECNENGLVLCPICS